MKKSLSMTSSEYFLFNSSFRRKQVSMSLAEPRSISPFARSKAVGRAPLGESRSRTWISTATSADKALVTPTGAVRRAAAAFPATICRPRSPSLSTATIRGTPLCSAMADSACPSRLRAHRRLAQRVRRGLGLNVFDYPRAHLAGTGASSRGRRRVRSREPRIRSSAEPSRPRDPPRFPAVMRSAPESPRAPALRNRHRVSILTVARFDPDQPNQPRAARVPSSALSTTATRAW